MKKLKKQSKEFFLVDYKGKYTVIQDKLWDDDVCIGLISKDQAIKQAKERLDDCRYYGIPAYIGQDKDLLEKYKQHEDK